MNARDEKEFLLYVKKLSTELSMNMRLILLAKCTALLKAARIAR